MQQFPNCLAGVVAAAVLCACTTVLADAVKIQADSRASTDGLGDFVGLISYEYDIMKGGHLMVELTNMTDRAIDGFITGFLFNINSTDPGAHALLMKTNYSEFLDTQMEDARPFGTFEAGAALKADWVGSGKPSGGIGIFQTGTFMFHIGAVDAPNLTAMSFLTGPLKYNFVVRFRGMARGATDGVPIQQVPAPAGFALLAGIGLLGASRRRSTR